MTRISSSSEYQPEPGRDHPAGNRTNDCVAPLTRSTDNRARDTGLVPPGTFTSRQSYSDGRETSVIKFTDDGSQPQDPAGFADGCLVDHLALRVDDNSPPLAERQVVVGDQ